MVRGYFNPMLLWIACSAVLLLVGCSGEIEPAGEPAGQEETAETEVLEAGATVLQTTAPLEPIDVYLVGFHPMKEDPDLQMEAHHFCNQVNEDFAQCVLFDGNTEDANLNGIEYIISERLFETLPEDEKEYWHPHNYEILSGQLVAPGLPMIADKELMESKMNSYGKTWHVWHTPMVDGSGDDLPLGESMLAWSFNRDGEAVPGLVERRNEEMDIDIQEMRDERADLVEVANPQSGVDALEGEFPRPTESLPGVEDAGAQSEAAQAGD